MGEETDIQMYTVQLFASWAKQHLGTLVWLPWTTEQNIENKRLDRLAPQKDVPLRLRRLHCEQLKGLLSKASAGSFARTDEYLT